MRKLLASTAAGLALFGGSVAVAATGIVGVAGAQDNGSTQTQPADGTARKGDGQHRRHLAKRVVTNIAEVLGMQPRDLLTELKTGKTVAQVANERGIETQSLIDQLVAKVNAKVDEAVANGKLSAERAAQIKQKAPERITKLVDTPLPDRATDAPS